MRLDHEETSTDEPATGLRERRRRETLRELTDAALDLFEQHGVHGTTVDDIARRAGTSPRTFFRYYATKEAAVFPPSDEARRVLSEAIALIRDGVPLARAIETGWVHLLAHFDAHPEEHRRAVRVRRLLLNEPALLALALRSEAEEADQLTDAAIDAAGADADVLTARAVVSTMSLIARVSFDEWVRRTELGQPASVHAIYLEIRRSVVSLAAELGDTPV